MKSKLIAEYPHPVLFNQNQDYVDCDFSISVDSCNDKGKTIELDMRYNLVSSGLNALVSEGAAKIVLRIICYRTSYRTIVEMIADGVTKVSIPKNKIADTIDFQASIVSTQNNDSYALTEFNPNFFNPSIKFQLRKGDVVAIEPGIKIKLNTVLEKSAAGVVQITSSCDVSQMKICYSTVDEADPALSNYIVIILPESDYQSYYKLRTKKHLKTDIDRFLQASIVLPAITEGISRIRAEETFEPEEGDPVYSGTIWAESIKNALNTLGVEDLSSCTKSDYELANLLLGNVCSDSLNNLMQKVNEWSTIRQEDDF